jgi:hypothetical protein
MAYARIIRQNFIKDPIIAGEFDIKERYFLIGLACIADDFGRIWYNEKAISSSVFPTDNEIDDNWIKETIIRFVDKNILCSYLISEKEFVHFPKWFEKGFCLKQRVDHPREYILPDCPSCQTERIKRESLRTIKGNSNKSKLKQQKEKEIRNSLLNLDYLKNMLNKYPNLNENGFTSCVDTYLDYIKKENRHKITLKNHLKEFEEILKLYLKQKDERFEEELW